MGVTLGGVGIGIKNHQEDLDGLVRRGTAVFLPLTPQPRQYLRPWLRGGVESE